MNQYGYIKGTISFERKADVDSRFPYHKQPQNKNPGGANFRNKCTCSSLPRPLFIIIIIIENATIK